MAENKILSFEDFSKRLGEEIPNTSTKITTMPEEQLMNDREVVYGGGSNIVGGLAVGMNEYAPYKNISRIVKSNLDYNTLVKFGWFFGNPVIGDNPNTVEIEEGLNWNSPQEQMGVSEQEWEDMDSSERQVQLFNVSDKANKEYWQPDTDSVGYMISRIGGGLIDPSVAIMMAKPLTIGAYGAADTALIQKGTTGEIDPLTTAYGFGAGYGLGKTIDVGKKIFFNKVSSKKLLQSVEDEMNQVAVEMNIANKDYNGVAIMEQAKNNLGLNTKAGNEMYDKALKVNKVKNQKAPASYSDALISIESASAKEVFKEGGKKPVTKLLDYLVEPISEGIKRISPRAYGKLKKVEREVFQDAHYVTNLTMPFLGKAFRAKINGGVLTQKQRDKLQLAMANAKNDTDVENINKFLKSTGSKGEALVKDYKSYRDGMSYVYKKRLEAGNKDLKEIIGYSPRKIVNEQRWIDGAPANQRSAIDKILKTKHKTTIKEADEVLIAKVVSEYLQSTGTKTKAKAGSSKQRVRETITEGQLKAYQHPFNATQRYIKESMEEIQRYKVFGADVIGKDDILEDTIAKYLAKEIKQGTLKEGKPEEELKRLFQARFINGPKQMLPQLKAMKDLGYMTMLGHPSNAIRQFGDLAASAHVNGVKAATKGFLATIRPGKLMTPKEMGLLDNMAEEFTSSSAIKKGVDTVFKYSGFRSVDALGKGALVNSSIYKAGSQVKTTKGTKEFLDEWSSILGGEDAVKAVSDFKAFNSGKIKKPTNVMKDIAFMKLSKIQPVTLSEMPKGYLNNPNGRMLYMLKSFTMKHINVIRQDITKEAAKGNYMKAAKNFTTLATFYTSMNMGADMMIDVILGRDTKLEDTAWTNFWRSTGFLSKYDVDRLVKDGDVYEFITEYPVPPLGQLYKGGAELGRAGLNIGLGRRWDDGMTSAGKDIYNNIPFVGKIMSAWLVD